MKKKLDTTKLLSIAVTILGLAGTLLSSKLDEKSREEMKAEIKEELKGELQWERKCLNLFTK